MRNKEVNSMERKLLCLLLTGFLTLLLSSCGKNLVKNLNTLNSAATDSMLSETISPSSDNGKRETDTDGSETYHGFVIDNVLHSESYGDILCNVSIPESYDSSCPYALYFTLPRI